MLRHIRSDCKLSLECAVWGCTRQCSGTWAWWQECGLGSAPNFPLSSFVGGPALGCNMSQNVLVTRVSFCGILCPFPPLTTGAVWCWLGASLRGFVSLPLWSGTCLPISLFCSWWNIVGASAALLPFLPGIEPLAKVIQIRLVVPIVSFCKRLLLHCRCLKACLLYCI